MLDLDEIVERRRTHIQGRHTDWQAAIDKLERKLEVLRKRQSGSDETRLEIYRRRAAKIVNKINHFVPHRMERWLCLPSWTVKEALVLLCDFDPSHSDFSVFNDLWRVNGTTAKRDSAVRLDGLDLGKVVVQEVIGYVALHQLLREAEENFEALSKLWQMGWHTQDRYTPRYFIVWALSKKFNVRWLSEAHRLGIFKGFDLPLPSASTLAIMSARMRDEEQSNTEVANSVLVTEQDEIESDSRVAWRIILEKNLAAIEAANGGKAGVADVIRWMKANGGDRITRDGDNDVIIWIDDNRTRQTVLKKTISNAITKAKSLLISQLPS